MSRRTGLILLLFGGYLVAALASLEIDAERVAEGVARGGKFLGGFLQPDFASRWSDVSAGMLESLTMTVTSTVVGVMISIPIGIGAARNLAPPAIYLFCRAIIALSRALQEIIIAILLVAMFGFGPFAGFLTLSFATIGFLSKLLAEDIEDIDEAQAEAIRIMGEALASHPLVVEYKKVERWGGSFPTTFMGGDAASKVLWALPGKGVAQPPKN